MTMPSHLTDAIASAAVAEPSAGLIPDTVPGRILHVDGDYLVYWSAIGEADKVGLCRHILCERVEAMKFATGSERVIVHLTARGSHKGWRRVISTIQPYQEQRIGTRKPTNWEAVRSWLEAFKGPQFTVVEWHDREADDAVAWAAAKNGPHLTAIATKDKDFRMIPGLHLVWDTFELVEVEEDTFELWHGDLLFGRKWFWLQMLVGDGADHIPNLLKGVYGYAASLDALSMSGPDDIGADVLSLYRQEHGDSAYSRFVEIAALLWMRTDRKALVDDFLKAMHCLPRHEWDRVQVAAKDLRERVYKHEQEINSIASKGSTHQAITAAELYRSADW